MKELTIEQKAQRYDEAIRKAKDMLSYKEVRQEDMEYLFPELKESEDERIRKRLCAVVNDIGENVLRPYLLTKDKVLAWLNKQGAPNPYSGVSFEYNGHTWGMCARDGGVEIAMDGNLKAFISSDKSFVYPVNPVPLFKAEYLYVSKVDGLIHDMRYNPIDKAEPKFAVGDWVVDEDDNRTYQIKRVMESVTSGKISYDLVGGGYFPSIKKNYHLWTIEDIKEGDVLYSKEHNLLWLHKNSEQCHSCINLNYNSNNISIDTDIVIPKDVCPATKEQSDLLYTKMREAGYMWDSLSNEIFTIDIEGADIKQISIRQVGAVKTILAKSGFTFENVKEDSTKDGYTTYGTFKTPSAIIVVRLSNHICSMKNWTERYKPKLIAKPKLLRRMGKNIQDPYKERCFFSIVFKAFDYSVNDSGSWKAICNEYVFNPIEVEEGGTIGKIANDAKGLNRGKPSTINGIQPQIREVNNESQPPTNSFVGLS